jgi:hypothetical protein
MAQLDQILLREFQSNPIVFLPAEKLPALLSASKIILEEDTLLSDYIRILLIKNSFIVQEKSPKNEIILRRFPDETTARNFVLERMEIYDKMWDGCGCKVSYYS